MKLKLSLAAVASLLTLNAIAAPTSITDTTAGSATRDGTIGGGEYIGSSSGINSGFGGALGNGTMYIDSSSSGTLNIGFALGGGWGDVIVIYIDSISGGFSDTSGFTDTGDDHRKAISGLDGSNRSTLQFATGFQADYAIAINSTYAGLWSLANGVSHNWISTADLTNPNVNQPEVSINLSDIGIAANSGASFNYVATYISSTAYRSDEYQGVAAQSFTQGWTTHTLASGDFNTFTTVPEPSTLALIGLGVIGIAARSLRRKA